MPNKFSKMTHFFYSMFLFILLLSSTNIYSQDCIADAGIFTGTIPTIFQDGNFTVQTTNFQDAGAVIDGGINTDTLIIPDGTGVILSSAIQINGFPNNAVLDDVNSIQEICVLMEHSFMRDLLITISCPNGTEIILNEFAGQTGGPVFIGEPFEDDELSEVIPGIGYEYCWTMDAANPTWIEFANQNNPQTLPAGNYQPFESLSNLNGCPINGEWSLNIEDLWGIDNGVVFSWSLSVTEDETSFNQSYLIVDPATAFAIVGQVDESGAFDFSNNPLSEGQYEVYAFNSIAGTNIPTHFLQIDCFEKSQVGCCDLLFLGILVVEEFTASCASGDDVGTPCDDGDPGTVNDIWQQTPSDFMLYQVEVVITWDETSPAFPDQAAHFSWFGGGTHNSNFKIWEEGQLASPGVDMMSVNGVTTLVGEEFDVGVMQGDADFAIQEQQWFCPDAINHPNCGVLTFDIMVNKNFPLISLVSMLGPSPDWFIGTESLSLINNDGAFRSQIIHELYPYDAGILSDNSVLLDDCCDREPLSVPQQPIHLITTESGETIGPASLGQLIFTAMPDPNNCFCAGFNPAECADFVVNVEDTITYCGVPPILNPVISSINPLDSVITFTWTGNQEIANNGPVTVDLLVDGVLPNSLSANSIVEVCIDTLIHSWVDDLEIFLVSPNQDVLELTTNNGMNGDNYLNTCFSISATDSISAATAPFTGNFLPEGDFENLYGPDTSPNGNWQLVIEDVLVGFNGVLSQWHITFNSGAEIDDLSYEWSPDINLSCTDCPNPTSSTTSITTYTVIVSDAEGCFSSDSVTVIFNDESAACIDDGDCANGMEIWDSNNCSCESIAPISGCTLIDACGYNPDATCDDGSCIIVDCNQDCQFGDIAVNDPNDPCNCIVETVTVSGCTDPDAINYDPDANCDNGSCDIVSTIDIEGTIFEIFPNPATDIIVILSNQNIDYQVDIFNILGQRVFSGGNVTNIDVSSFVGGTYFVKIKEQEHSKIASIKLIVSHY